MVLAYLLYTLILNLHNDMLMCLILPEAGRCIGAIKGNVMLCCYVVMLVDFIDYTMIRFAFIVIDCYCLCVLQVSVDWVHPFS